MYWQRKAGVALMAAGGLLLAAFVVPTVYGRAMSHLAVAEFRAESGSHRLWDSARIRAYQRTLAMVMPTPEGVLRVPKAGIEVPVYEGTSDLVLNRGVGHVTGTALPGEAGNVAITGHRDGFFRGLKDLAVGDKIEVQRSDTAGGTDTYVVDRIHIVLPGDTSVLNNTGRSTLTLITCYPFYYVGAAPQRYIVQAIKQGA
ncbi:sortase [Granulicella sp. 5B5]|uniref:class D sortase n=1 Tax=Granulicella sp. 5B5 TaxID=1617967 RepID=UPI0015F3E09C|nr:class D sortase [Granulicella sp. 5B5]QMV17374.1 sortase [Granulicella sp. 5B5]